MAVPATPNGAEKDERSGRHEARKGVPVRARIPLAAVGAFLALLIITKIIVSGFYLRSKTIPLTTPGLAMADSGAPANTAPEAEASPPLSPNLAATDNKIPDLNSREVELQKREEELLPLKNEIDEKLAELNELQARLTVYAKQLAEREKVLEDSKMGHLVDLYTAMEPERAAAIMDKLKIPTVVRILRHMKGKSAGKILAMMKPEKGAVISERLSLFD